MNRVRLAILTPDPADAYYAPRWQAAYEQYQGAFAAAGVETVAAPWVEPWPTDVAAALAVRAWGYHKRIEHWRAMLNQASIKLINPSPILLWNTEKTYLGGLAEAGAPVVPTRFTEVVNAEGLAKAFAAFKTDRLVVKPTVSAGSYFTQVVKPGDAPPAIPGTAMIQPFLDAVRGEGEISLFYFAGLLSHAARKVAAEGDFRVQPQFGGAMEKIEADAEMQGVARAVLAATPGKLTYARVDMIRDRDGRLKLMELEAIEPDLFLELDPDAAGRFVEAVVAALG